jgi:hypothetical protein
VKPLATVRVRACVGVDATCASPLADGTTDDQGFTTLTLRTSGTSLGFQESFAGYLLFTPPDPAYAEQLYFESPPVRGTTPLQECLGTQAQWSALAATEGATFDGTKGLITFMVRDCFGQPVIGAVVENSAGAPVYYEGANRTPGSGLTQTMDTGQGAIGPLDPGAVHLTVKLGETGAPIASYDVLVRAGIITNIGMYPTP